MKHPPYTQAKKALGVGGDCKGLGVDLQVWKRMGFSVRDASRATSLSVSTLYELMAAGQLHYLKFGARRIIPAASLAALMGSK